MKTTLFEALKDTEKAQNILRGAGIKASAQMVLTDDGFVGTIRVANPEQAQKLLPQNIRHIKLQEE